MAVVSNASPLIAFADIGQLHLLPAMFVSLAIPPAVARELASKRHALIPRIRPHLDALITASFFIGPDLYDALLRLAGESDG